MESIFVIVGLTIIVICAIIAKETNSNSIETNSKENTSDESSNTISKNNTAYIRKNFLTNNELIFLNKLKELEMENGLKVVPQVNLATIIKKISDIPYQNELFRNIDYGIFSNNYERLLLLIELNDSSHQSQNRQYRDKKVHEICEMAGIKLIRFYTKYPNEKEYVKNRIRNEILK
ncbi:MAG: DUF2726 domain-containing protein [Bacilli bacterium]